MEHTFNSYTVSYCNGMECMGRTFLYFFEKNRVISSIIVFFSPYFMPLLFVLVGMSTKYALEKRTYKEYLVERVKRLFIPFCSE